MQLNRKEAADMLGVTSRLIGIWENDGLKPVDAKAKPIVYEVSELLRFLYERSQKAAITDDVIDYNKERARKEKSLADLAERDVKERDSNLLDKNEVLANLQPKIGAALKIIDTLKLDIKRADPSMSDRALSEIDRLTALAVNSICELPNGV